MICLCRRPCAWALLAVLLWVQLAPGFAQSPVVHHLNAAEPAADVYKLWRGSAANRRLVVLLPPYGGNEDYYDHSALPKHLEELGMDLAVVHPGAVGYHDDKDVRRLDALIVHLLRSYRYDVQGVAIGGFSAGGYGALRYAVMKISGEADLAVRPAALFAVDAPLDLERWYLGMDTFLRRVGPSDSNDNPFYGESQFLTEMLRRLFGGTPAQQAAAYRALSVVSSSLPDGGNARHLKDVPLRLYSEPDMDFYVDFGIDYLATNAFDQVALTSILKARGGREVSLVLTSGKGYRHDLGGIRMPHSWAIVDEAELAQWLAKQLD